METLESRRHSICLTFARKALKSDQFKQWFSVEKESEPLIKTRHYKPKPKLKPVTCRNKKYKNSPIPFLTELLNNDFEKQKQRQSK